MSQFMTLALPCHQKSKTVLPASKKKREEKRKLETIYLMKTDTKFSKYISKLSSGEYRKNNTLQTSEVYPGNSKMDWYLKVNPCNPLYQHSKKKNLMIIPTDAEKHWTKFSIYSFFLSQQTRNIREPSQPNKGHLQKTYSLQVTSHLMVKDWILL